MIKNSIVLVPFPFDDFSSSKVRPVICLTPEIGKFKHIIVAFISSNVKNQDELFDILIEKETESFDKTGLITDSIIKLHRLTTIPKKLIKRKLGEANPILVKKIKSNLVQLFELDKNI